MSRRERVTTVGWAGQGNPATRRALRVRARVQLAVGVALVLGALTRLAQVGAGGGAWAVPVVLGLVGVVSVPVALVLLRSNGGSLWGATPDEHAFRVAGDEVLFPAEDGLGAEAWPLGTTLAVRVDREGREALELCCPGRTTRAYHADTLDRPLEQVLALFDAGAGAGDAGPSGSTRGAASRR